MLLRPCGYLGALVRFITLVIVLALLCAPAVAGAAVIDVPAGGDLQGALNSAQPGDIVELEPGAIYVGNFVLPVKEGATEIVVRTRAAAGQPARGRRVTPAHAGVLAKLQSPNSLPAVQTAASAHHWRLELLELGPNEQGFGEILRLGLGGSGQDRMELVPHHLVIDRCYIHGDPAVGQKRGIGLNSAATTIINSHISDIKGAGFDTQAIGGWNGPGPYVIENNYLEAAGENVMFGGSDPMIANLTPSDITFRGNHLSKPREWRGPIIPAPAASASPMAGGGTLPAGTYAYRVVARRYVGQWTMGGSDPSTEVTATLTASGAVQVQWTAVDGATEYRVYGRTAGAQKEYWTVRGTSWIDAGTPGAAGAVPTAGSRWTVKNLFELKHAQRVLVEGNVFENSWAHAQGGLALVMTPRNPGGIAPWTVVADVTIRYNLIRHAGGGLSINGYDTNHVSEQAHNIRVEQNLFYDINDDEDGIGRFLIMGGGPRQVTFDHNTIVLDGTVMLVHGKNADGTYDYVEDFQFSNNLTLHNRWGLVGEGGGGLGTPSILTYFGSPTTVVSNVLAGGPAPQYPATNLFPSVDAFWAEFADAHAGDYRLRESSPYRNAGTDGLDLGADVERIEALARGAISGTGDARPPVAVPGGPYAASTLTDVTFDGGGSWDPDGAIVSYTWDWSDGCPSTQGPIATHQFTHAGTFAVTLTVVDESGAVASATVPAEIVNRPPYADAGGPYVTAPGGTLELYAGGSHDSDGQIIEYRWSWGDGSPEQVTSNASVTHTYASAGDYTAVLTVVDDVGAAASDAAAVSVQASAPLPGSGPQAPEIVIHAADLPASAVHGAWIRELDPTAASAGKLSTADAGWSSTSAPRATPEHYVDVTFRAKGNTLYRLWLRMAAAGNSKWNDSVWVQFDGAVNGSGTPLYRIGTTSGLLVNLATDSRAALLNGWGWQNGAYWLSQETAIRFASDGVQTLRVQTREDGVQIDQIVLSPAAYFTAPPGPIAGDVRIVAKPLTDVVMHADDVMFPGSHWQLVADETAAGGRKLSSPNGGWSTTNVPLAEPTRFIDVEFQAQANMDYRVWLRLRALDDSKYNDAVWVQFSDAVAGGVPRYGIGTTDGLLVNLATTALATSLNGWGWQKGAYWKTEREQPTIVRFPTTGTHTIRVQVREDGVMLDQIVLSPARYLDWAPGTITADGTIVPK